MDAVYFVLDQPDEMLNYNSKKICRSIRIHCSDSEPICLVFTPGYLLRADAP